MNGTESLILSDNVYLTAVGVENICVPTQEKLNGKQPATKYDRENQPQIAVPAQLE